MVELPSGLRAFWRLNRGARLLAFLLAVIVWYAIREATSFEATVEDVPITVLHDEGMAVLDLSDESTDVRFAGARADIRDLSRAQTQVIVDVRGRSMEGRQTVPVSTANVRAPRGCRAVFVRVDRISFSLDREAEKTVPVKVDVQGAPPPGYEIDRFICSPAAVTVRGPSTQLDTLEFVRTAPIDLEGRLQSFKVRRNIVVPGPAWAARVEPDRVLVEAIVTERSAIRTIERAPVRLMSGTEDRFAAVLDPARVNVVIQGLGEAITDLPETAIQPFVDVSGLPGAGPYDLKVRIYSSAAIRVLSVEPPTVKVEIKDVLRP